MKGLIPSGHYGIPECDEEIIDLGTSVDMLPLARRPKAIDMTDMEALVISYDMESAEFKRIAAQSAETDSHCQYGPSFLVYERSNGRFLEFFCGNKSSRIEAKKLFPFLPLTQADIDAKAAAGNDVGDLKPHGPIPVTLKTKVAENRKGTWHVPVVVMCAAPFARLPSGEVICVRSASSSRSRITASRRSRTPGRPAPASHVVLSRRTCPGDRPRLCFLCPLDLALAGLTVGSWNRCATASAGLSVKGIPASGVQCNHDARRRIGPSSEHRLPHLHWPRP